MLKKFVILSFIMWLFLPTYSQDFIEINDNLQSIKIGKNLSYYIDDSKTVTYNEIANKNFDDKFIKSEKLIPFFDYQYSTTWLKFTVSNNSNNSAKFNLFIDYPLLYKIRLFVADSIKVDTFFSGDGYNFEKRIIKDVSNIFELSLNANETKTYICSIESDGDVVTLPISIVSDEYFFLQSEKRLLILGFYYGLLVLVIIINLFYYKNMNDRSYLFYIIYIIFLALYLFARDGLAFKYLWPNMPVWNNISVSVFSMMTVVTVLLMIKNTLQTKTYFPVIDKIIFYLMMLTSGMVMVSIFSQAFYRFMISFGNIITGIAIILAIVTIVKALKKKIYFAKYFFAAIIFLIIGALWLVMKNNGVTGIFEFEHGMKIGSGLEVIILAYGLTVKFKNMLKESQEQAIKRLEEINKMKEFANLILEKEVKKRTLELQKSNEELKSANLEINQQKEEIKASAENLQKLNENLTQKNKEINAQSEILRATNELLRERNEEVNQQKEEIIAQRDEISNQRDIVMSQKSMLTHSIVYAKRIQKALFPPKSLMNEIFKDYFVFFKPRDIVSGDFYWVKKFNNSILIAVVDCTGHGVPGAFMSMLGIAFLNEVIIRKNIDRPDKALNALREIIIATLHQTGEKNDNKDGMDIAFCEILPDKKLINFSGANMPLCLIKNTLTSKEIIYAEGDKMPIGIYQRSKDFSNQQIEYNENDMLYIFTDGFRDQFGEKENRKFLLSNFKEMLLKISSLDIKDQYLTVNNTFTEWKGNNKQIDDVTVIGIKL